MHPHVLLLGRSCVRRSVSQHAFFVTRCCSHRAMTTCAGAPGLLEEQTDACVVLVTTPSAEVSHALARSLVTSQLAACVNILPAVTSVYSWQGALQEDSEQLLVVKTRRQLLSNLNAAVLRLHPYDTPEVIALPVTAGSRAYLRWLCESTSKPDLDVALAAGGTPPLK
jgi:uncharacterized protein involved in tolerance to divalent cations